MRNGKGNVSSLAEYREAKETRDNILSFALGSKFVVRQQGGGLMGRLIFPGDYLFCTRVGKLERGQLGIFFVQNHGVFARVLASDYEDPFIRLDSASAYHPSLCLPFTDVVILGCVYGMARDFNGALFLRRRAR